MRALLLAVIMMAGCAPLPESYPVPEQRTGKDGPDPGPIGSLVTFSDLRSPDYVVSGFLPGAPDQLWRWGTENPTVRVRVSSAKGLRLRANFSFPENSHKPLLPITVSYFVNNKLLEAVQYRAAGVHEYRKPVPPEWLLTDADNLIRLNVSPTYTAAADQQKLSLVLSEIGLEKNE